VNFNLFYGEQNFSTTDISHIFVGAQRNLPVLGVWRIGTYSPIRELLPGGPVMSCGDVHQSFTDTVVKWFFCNFPVFADSSVSFLFTVFKSVAPGLDAKLSVYTSAPHRAVVP